MIPVAIAHLCYAVSCLTHIRQVKLIRKIKFIGLGEQADDLQPFDARQFAEALFERAE